MGNYRSKGLRCVHCGYRVYSEDEAEEHAAECEATAEAEASGGHGEFASDEYLERNGHKGWE